MIRLHLGCGAIVRPGFDNIDALSTAPGVIRDDPTNLSARYKPGSVSEIYAFHVLEYVPQPRIGQVLRHWAELLEPGGRLGLIALDLDKQIACYQSGLWNAETFMRMSSGPGGPANQRHLSFSARDLAAKLGEAGFQTTHLAYAHDNLIADPQRSNNPSFELISTKGRVVGWGPDASGLGDLIMLTPLCNVFPGEVTVQIPTKAARFACIFDGVARVQLIDPPFKSPRLGDGIYVQQMLRAMGKPDASCVPRIALKDEEIEQAREFLKPYPNPLVLVVNCAAHWKHMREFDPAKWQTVVDQIKDRYTILQFGVSSNFTPIAGTTPIKDLPIRQAAAVYHVAGKYIGVDTGDFHLTIAAGGKAIVVVPPSNPYYDHQFWHIHPHYWPGKPRTMYLPAEQMLTIPQRLSFFES
jgi:hypothetical protein